MSFIHLDPRCLDALVAVYRLMAGTLKYALLLFNACLKKNYKKWYLEGAKLFGINI